MPGSWHTPYVLVIWGQLRQGTLDWVAYKQQIPYLVVLKNGKSEIMAPVGQLLVRALLRVADWRFLVSSRGGEQRKEGALYVL